MDKKALKQSLHKYLKAIREHAAKVAPNFHPEDLHTLRTNVKKLRALLSLHIRPDIGLPHSFKQLYHTSGYIRDAQVQLQHLVARGGDEVLSAFAVWLATYISRHQHTWDNEYNEQALADLEHYINHLHLADISPDELSKFFRHAISEVGIIVSATPNDESLHEVRRQIKTLLYIVQWLENKCPEASPAISSFSEDELKQLSNLAGTYNDERIGLTLFESYMKDEKDEQLLISGQSEQERWLHQKSRKRQQLIEAMHSFTASVHI